MEVHKKRNPLAAYPSAIWAESDAHLSKQKKP